jgi:hypothetical protein
MSMVAFFEETEQFSTGLREFRNKMGFKVMEKLCCERTEKIVFLGGIFLALPLPPSFAATMRVLFASDVHELCFAC